MTVDEFLGMLLVIWLLFLIFRTGSDRGGGVRVNLKPVIPKPTITPKGQGPPRGDLMERWPQ